MNPLVIVAWLMAIHGTLKSIDEALRSQEQRKETGVKVFVTSPHYGKIEMYGWQECDGRYAWLVRLQDDGDRPNEVSVRDEDPLRGMERLLRQLAVRLRLTMFAENRDGEMKIVVG